MSGNEKELEMVKKHAEALGEHFDNVQIFVSRHESGEQGGTVNVIYGLGNWFARHGLVHEWMVKEDEATREHQRSKDKE